MKFSPVWRVSCDHLPLQYISLMIFIKVFFPSYFFRINRNCSVFAENDQCYLSIAIPACFPHLLLQLCNFFTCCHPIELLDAAPPLITCCHLIELLDAAPPLILVATQLSCLMQHLHLLLAAT